MWETDVGGTRRLAVAAREEGVGHLLLVSVPGADDVPYSYNHAKHAAEEVVAAAGVPYTVLRATQFHPFLALLIESGWASSTPCCGAGAVIGSGWSELGDGMSLEGCLPDHNSGSRRRRESGVISSVPATAKGEVHLAGQLGEVSRRVSRAAQTDHAE